MKSRGRLRDPGRHDHPTRQRDTLRALTMSNATPCAHLRRSSMPDYCDGSSTTGQLVPPGARPHSTPCSRTQCQTLSPAKVRVAALQGPVRPRSRAHSARTRLYDRGSGDVRRHAHRLRPAPTARGSCGCSDCQALWRGRRRSAPPRHRARAWGPDRERPPTRCGEPASRASSTNALRRRSTGQPATST